MLFLLRWIAVVMGITLLMMSSVVAIARRDSEPFYLFIDSIQMRPANNLYDPTSVIRLSDGALLRTFNEYGLPDEPQWSSNWRWLFSIDLTLKNTLSRLKISGKYSEVVAQEVSDYGLSYSPDHQWVAFARQHNEAYELYRIEADGRGLQRITNVADVGFVFWSPDSQWIYFQTDANLVHGSSTLYRVHPDGQRLERLLDLDGNAQNWRWSPDGNWLLFEFSEGDNLNISHLFTVKADGSEVYELVTLHPNNLTDSAFWSADSEWIIYQDNPAEISDLYRIRRDGTERQQLTNDAMPEFYFQPSPDREWILYQIEKEDFYAAIHLMRVDGSQHRVLADNASTLHYSVWLHDSQTILLAVRTKTETVEDVALKRISIDGTETQTLANFLTGYSDFNYQLVMNGEWLFYHYQDTNLQFKRNLVRIDGSEIIPLHDDNIKTLETSPPVDLPYHQWLPAGTGFFLLISGVFLRKHYAL